MTSEYKIPMQYFSDTGTPASLFCLAPVSSENCVAYLLDSSLLGYVAN